jgi:hypothetical protein
MNEKPQLALDNPNFDVFFYYCKNQNNALILASNQRVRRIPVGRKSEAPSATITPKCRMTLRSSNLHFSERDGVFTPSQTFEALNSLVTPKVINVTDGMNCPSSCKAK